MSKKKGGIKETKPFSEMDAAERIKTRVSVGRHLVKHTATHEGSTTFAGSKNALEEFREQFGVEIMDYEKDDKYGEHRLRFDMAGVDAPIANTIRRVLLAEVPTIAIENVLLYNNTSLIQDEVLAHRLGLIPMLVDPESLAWKTKEEEHTEENTLVFKLDITCKRKKDAPKDGTPDEMYENHRVTTADLEWMPMFGQEAKFGDNPPRPVHDDILIAKLRPGQTIEVEVQCVKGVGKDHAKFSPVSTASYRLLPEIGFTEDVLDEKAEELVKLCPMNVFDIEDLGGGSKKAVVARPRDCTMCRECIREDKWNDRVRLRRVKNHFCFSIESTGIVPPVKLMQEALNTITRKCESYLAVLDGES